MLEQLGRIRIRLLVVNLVVLLVPVAGLEFARIHERQLLASLERDMRNQAALVRQMLEVGMRGDPPTPLESPAWQEVLVRAAERTRTRVRVLDAAGQVRLDSHRDGPPEGPEPPAPSLIPESAYESSATLRRGSTSAREVSSSWSRQGPRWPDVPDRREVRAALEGHPSGYTRIRDAEPAVLLFVTEPVQSRGVIVGVVYLTRSTQPVLVELYRIRSGLFRVLGVALVFTLLLSLMLAWSISRPLGRLARAARRITRGERGVTIEVSGGGEIRELGEALRTMTTELDERMRYIRELSADVGHELKSPLTSIRGAAELLAEGAADDPVARARFLENIQLDAERLERLVNRLLELSRIDSSREPYEEFDLEAMVRRVLERTTTTEAPVELVWETDVRRWRGREEDLERALLNLVENALRFSPDGEPVRVTVSSPARDRLEIAVSDRGPGVPEKHREQVFERFFTTDAERNGTGLGLAIVKSVAAAHGGDVALVSEEGSGATFTLRLRLR